MPTSRELRTPWYCNTNTNKTENDVHTVYTKSRSSSHHHNSTAIPIPPPSPRRQPKQNAEDIKLTAEQEFEVLYTTRYTRTDGQVVSYHFASSTARQAFAGRVPLNLPARAFLSPCRGNHRRPSRSSAAPSNWACTAGKPPPCRNGRKPPASRYTQTLPLD